jgi:hypothetical protein
MQENAYHRLLLSRDNYCLLDHESWTPLVAQCVREKAAEYNPLAFTIEALFWPRQEFYAAGIGYRGQLTVIQ